MHHIIHASYTQINTKVGIVTNFTKWWVGSKMISSQGHEQCHQSKLFCFYIC